MKLAPLLLLLTLFAGCAAGPKTTEEFLKKADEAGNVYTKRFNLEGVTLSDAKAKMQEMSDQCFNFKEEGSKWTSSGTFWHQARVIAELDETPEMFRTSVRYQCQHACNVDDRREGKITIVISLTKDKTGTNVVIQNMLYDAERITLNISNWLEGKKKLCPPNEDLN